MTVSNVRKPLMNRRFSHRKSDRLITPLVASGEASFHFASRRWRFSVASRIKARDLTIKAARDISATVWLSWMKKRLRVLARSKRVEMPR